MKPLSVKSIKLVMLNHVYYVTAFTRNKREFTFPHSSRDLEKMQALATKMDQRKTIDPNLWVQGNVLNFRTGV